MSLVLARVWIALCATLVVCGWGLSARGALSREGYGVALILAVGFWAMVARGMRWPAWRWGAWRRRGRRVWPLAWVVIFAGVVLGGLLYAPSNYDALAYRVPRVVQWLQAREWFWIPSDFLSLNTRTAVTEWLMAPVLLFAGTERWVWVGNAVCFALLPGLVFSLDRALGGAGRAVYAWMWLLPTGWVFVLQAGGIANDLLGAWFALAAMVLGMRARRTGVGADLIFSMLAVALCTGVKTSNAPLVLPWVVAVWPVVRGLWGPRRFQAPVPGAGAAREESGGVARSGQLAPATIMLPSGELRGAAGVGGAVSARGRGLGWQAWWLGLAALVSVVCSFLPQAVINALRLGEWSAAQAELGPVISASPAWARAAGNVLGLVAQNGNPPVFPVAGAWNAAVERALPAGVQGMLDRSFEADAKVWRAIELPYEDWASYGMTLCLLVGVSAVVLWHRGERRRPVPGTSWVLGAVWVAFAAYLCAINLLSVGRLTAPYYLLLALPVVAWSSTAMVRSGWWRGLAGLHVACTALVLVLAPSRPLWPAQTVLARLQAWRPGTPALERMARVYGTYRERPEALAPVRALLPPGARRVAVVTYHEPSASLLRLYAREREFWFISPRVTRAELAAMGVDTLVVSSYAVGEAAPDAETWLRERGVESTGQVTLQLRASGAPSTWHVGRVLPTSPTPKPGR